MANVVNNRKGLPGREFWTRQDVRVMLAARGIGSVYNALRANGWSEQAVAAMTGQSQPEVSAIVHGRRVYTYDVLARIKDGLGAPRGLAGLAYCPYDDYLEHREVATG